MPYKLFFIVLVLGFLCFLSCNPVKQEEHGAISNKGTKNSIRYSKHFSLEEHQGFTILTLFGKKETLDTTAVYVLSDSLKPHIKTQHLTYYLKVPSRRVVALSSIYSAMLAELNALNYLVAIDNIDYVNHHQIIEKHGLGHISEVAKGPVPDMEKVLSLQPDMVLMFGMGNPEEEAYPVLHKAGIASALIVDHLEETPLARAEWIKFIAAFVGKGKQADSVFKTVERKYLALKDSIKKQKLGPKVLSELKYGDTWYVPGGKSFMSTFITDAGGQYAWKDNQASGSLPLSFEQVYRSAADAGVWINLSMVRNKKDMLAQDERYQNFLAFQTNRLYNNNKRVNNKGYSDYWETAMFHPERVLHDLVLLFHSTEVDEKELYYYRNIR